VASLHAVASPRKGSRPACAHEARPADAIDFSDQLLAALSEYDWAADDGLVEEYRPTIAEPPYEPPTLLDEAWHEGLTAGLDNERHDAPIGYGPAERCAYRVGWLCGEHERWEEYTRWSERYEHYRDFETASEYGYAHPEFRG
jgi:hypothetical protein